MQIDAFLELVKKRRSCRAFKPNPVPDGYIEKILESARWAMSGANGQPWEFIVVKDKEIRNQILSIYAAYQNEKWYMEQTRIEELRTTSSHSVNRPEVINFREAPVIIVVCGDPRTLQTTVVGGTYLACEGGFDAIYFKNMANTTQIIHLAVAALGLSSEWISVSYMIEGRLKNLLNVPDQLVIPTMIPIGYPAHPPPTPYRRELKEIMHFDRYDRAKFRSSEDVINFIRNVKRQKRSAPKNPGDVPQQLSNT